MYKTKQYRNCNLPSFDETSLKRISETVFNYCTIQIHLKVIFNVTCKLYNFAERIFQWRVQEMLQFNKFSHMYILNNLFQHNDHHCMQ